jgi:hypothetical protein
MLSSICVIFKLNCFRSMADLLSSLQHIYQSWDRKCHQGKRPAMSEDKKMSTLGLRAYSAAKRTALKQFEESNTTKVRCSKGINSSRVEHQNAMRVFQFRENQLYRAKSAPLASFKFKSQRPAAPSCCSHCTPLSKVREDINFFNKSSGKKM